MKVVSHNWMSERDLYLLLAGALANLALTPSLPSTLFRTISILATILTTFAGIRAVIKSTSIVFQFNTKDDYPIINGLKTISIPESAHGKGLWPTFKFTIEDGELVLGSQKITKDGTIVFAIPHEIELEVTAVIK